MRLAPISGHIFRGRRRPMLDNHWALVEAALLIAACGVVGALLGSIVSILKKDGRE